MLKLYKYQEEGISLIHKWKHCIVGDQMGLGKTISASVAIDRVTAYPLLIICPASLKPNWEIEFNKWTGKTAMILNNSIRNTFPIIYKSGLAHAFICNYESLSKFFVHSMPTNRKELRLKDIIFNNYKDFFKSVIFDEGHRTKDPLSIQSKLCRGICAGKEYILDLTGTPVMNKTTDLAPQLAIIEQIDKFGGYQEFLKTYENADTFSLKTLGLKLRETCYFRREKKDVLELPEKTRQKIIIDIDNRVEYDEALKDLANYLREWKGKTDAEIKKSMRGEIVVKIGVLKNISERGKISSVLENINDAVAQGEKVVLFGYFKEALDQFKVLLPNSVSITGEDNSERRQANIEKFQNDPNCKVIRCSIGAGSVGITLTAARIMMINALWWNPAIQSQIEDRIHRIGQTRDAHCIYFLGKNTIDEWIYDLIEEKRKLSNDITGSTEDIEWCIVEKVIELILKTK